MRQTVVITLSSASGIQPASELGLYSVCPNRKALLVTTRAEGAILTRKRARIFVRAVVAADAGEAVLPGERAYDRPHDGTRRIRRRSAPFTPVPVMIV